MVSGNGQVVCNWFNHLAESTRHQIDLHPSLIQQLNQVPAGTITSTNGDTDPMPDILNTRGEDTLGDV